MKRLGFCFCHFFMIWMGSLPALAEPVDEFIAEMKEHELPIKFVEFQLAAANADKDEIGEYTKIRDSWKGRRSDYKRLRRFLIRLHKDPCDKPMRGGTILDSGNYSAIGGQSIELDPTRYDVEGVTYDWFVERESTPVPIETLYSNVPSPFTLGDWIYDRDDGCPTAIDHLPPIVFAEEPIDEDDVSLNDDAVRDAEKRLFNGSNDPPVISDEPEYGFPDDPARTLDCSQYLCGRDIIFVHGLDANALQQPAAVFSNETWQNGVGAAAFEPGGFWYRRANDYFENHLGALQAKGASNRYILAPWALTDRAPQNVLAIAAMINRAGNGEFIRQLQPSGIGTANPDNDIDQNPLTGNQARSFCNPSCVIVSESTGALLADLFMGMGAKIRTPAEQAFFGDLDVLTQRLKFHLAFDGAFGGSDYALPLGIALDHLASEFNDTVSTPQDQIPSGAGARSIAVDLSPLVASSMWHPVINHNQTPVLMIASASPDGRDLGPFMPDAIRDALGTLANNNLIGNAATNNLGSALGVVLKALLPGPDDSVLPASSSCANNIPSMNRPSGNLVPLLQVTRVFNRGDPDRSRAVRQLWNQMANKRGGGLAAPNYVAQSCTPFISSTGMVLPRPQATPAALGADHRLRRHCPVLISSLLHASAMDRRPDPGNREVALVVPQNCGFLYDPDANVPNDGERYLSPAIGRPRKFDRTESYDRPDSH